MAIDRKEMGLRLKADNVFCDLLRPQAKRIIEALNAALSSVKQVLIETEKGLTESTGIHVNHRAMTSRFRSLTAYPDLRIYEHASDHEFRALFDPSSFDERALRSVAYEVFDVKERGEVYGITRARLVEFLRHMDEGKVIPDRELHAPPSVVYAIRQAFAQQGIIDRIGFHGRIFDVGAGPPRADLFPANLLELTLGHRVTSPSNPSAFTYNEGGDRLFGRLDQTELKKRLLALFALNRINSKTIFQKTSRQEMEKILRENDFPITTLVGLAIAINPETTTGLMTRMSVLKAQLGRFLFD